MGKYFNNNQITGPQKLPISTHLKNGAELNAIGNYATPTIFKLQPAAGEIYRVTALIVHISDVGTFDSGGYGADATPLTNGIEARVQNDSTTLATLTNGEPIKSQLDWQHWASSLEYFDFGLGAKGLSAIIRLADYGQDIRLVGDNNERLEVVLNDDFTFLTGHHFTVKGYIE